MIKCGFAGLEGLKTPNTRELSKIIIGDLGEWGQTGRNKPSKAANPQEPHRGEP